VIGSTRAVRVFARRKPTDLRKGFDGLYGLVRNELGQDPLKGDLYLFVNRRRTSGKVLHWDGTGLCIYAKRLAKKRFTKLWEDAESSTPLTITQTELSLFLEGADLSRMLPISPEEIRL
jgi:transposase